MKKLLGPLLTAFAFILIAYSFVTAVDRIVWMHGLAHAQGAGSGSAMPIDVAIQAIQGADQGWGLVSAYGWIWGGGLLFYAALSKFLEKNNSTHWIAQGRNLALLVAGCSLLGSVLMQHFAGAPAAGIVATAFVSAAKLILPMIVKSPQVSS